MALDAGLARGPGAFEGRIDPLRSASSSGTWVMTAIEEVGEVLPDQYTKHDMLRLQVYFVVGAYTHKGLG